MRPARSGSSVLLREAGLLIVERVRGNHRSLLLDLAFSIDSILTAIGITDHVSSMVVAVVLAVALMLLGANPLANFVKDNPTVIMLALGFLLMIGMVLIAEGFGAHVPKGYIYGGMVFSALLEGLNLLSRQRAAKRPPTGS